MHTIKIYFNTYKENYILTHTSYISSMTNFEIWEKHYTNKKGTKEPPESFQTFQKYLHTRNLRKLAEQIIKEEYSEMPQDSLKIDELVRKKYEQLKYYSKTYDFKNRAYAYDMHIAKKSNEVLELDLLLAKKEAVEGLSNIIKDTRELVKSDELSINQLYNCQKAIVGAYKGIHDILHDFVAKKDFKADVKVDKHMGLARLFTEEELAEMKEDLKNVDDIDKMIDELDDDFSEFE